MADLLRLHNANQKCKRFIGAYDDLPDDWEARSRYIKPMFTRDPPPFLEDDEAKDYCYQHGKMVNALNIIDPKRSQLDKASHSRLAMWHHWFESRSRWESYGHPEPDFACNDGQRGYFNGTTMSIGATKTARVAPENALGTDYAALGYHAAGTDAEDLEDGFASAELDETDDLDDIPSELRDFTEDEDEEDVGGEEIVAAGVESGYETGLTDKEVEEEHEEISEAGVQGEDLIDFYKINFTPINGPVNLYVWTPCCLLSCVLCSEHKRSTEDTVLDD